MSEETIYTLPFIPLTLEHRELFENQFSRFPQQLSWYNFANLFGWSPIYKNRWVQFPDGTVIITAYIPSLKQEHFFQPIGPFGEEAQKLLLAEIAQRNYPVKLIQVSRIFTENFPRFCSHFTVDDDRNFANYVYRASDLAELEGRSYEKKRNLISQLDKTYPWTIVPLKEFCPHCPKILREIGAKENPDPTLQEELQALDNLLSHYDRLKLAGFMIVIDGKPRAFAISTVLNPNTKSVIIEKADRNYKGLYQLINRETSKAIWEEGFSFINREEDLGDEGLRQAKLSYHPVELISSLTLTAMYTERDSYQVIKPQSVKSTQSE